MLKRTLLCILTLGCLLVSPSLFAQAFTSQNIAVLDSQTREDALENLRLIGQLGSDNLTVAVNGKFAYVANGARLVVLDFSNPSNLTQVGSITLPDSALHMKLAGNTIFLTTEKLLVSVAVENPTTPQIVGVHDVPDVITALGVGGGYAYLGLYVGECASGGLKIIDISDRTSVMEKSTVCSGVPLDIAVADSYAYINYESVVQVMDISDPTMPIVVGTEGARATGGIVVQGDYAYVSDGENGLLVIDVTDPSRPTRIRSANVGGKGIAISGNYLYVSGMEFPIGTTSQSGLWVVDVSDPSDPKVVGLASSETPPIAFAVLGTTVIGAYDRGELRLLDASQPSEPIVKGTKAIEPSLPDGAAEVAVSGDYAYVAGEANNEASALYILDITSHSDLSVISTLEMQGAINEIAVRGSYLYIAGTAGVLRIINVSDPTNPFEVGSYQAEGSIASLFLSGDFAYLTNDADLDCNCPDLIILNIGNPTAPTLVGTYSTGQQIGISDVTVVGRYAYLAGAELSIVDVSVPASPVLLSTYDTQNYPSGQGYTGAMASVVARDEYVYVIWNSCLLGHGCWPNGVDIVDVSDPTTPVAVGRFLDIQNFKSYNGMRDLALFDQHLYIAGRQGGLLVLDVTVPEHPMKVAGYDTTGQINDVAVTSDKIYLADIRNPFRAPSGPNDGEAEGFLVLQARGSVQGTVTQANGTPVEGVALRTQQEQEATTDSAGRYRFSDLSGISFTITPALAGYTFLPPTRTISLFEDTTSASFTLLTLPVSTTLTHNATTTLSYNDTQGLLTNLHFPIGTVGMTTTVHLTPTAVSAPLGSAFTGHAFDLTATQNGAPQPNLTFNQPVTLTIRYSDADLRLVRDEAELTVTRWNGSEWAEATTDCGAPANYTRDEEANLLTLPICVTGRYALIGPTHQQFLPFLFGHEP